MEFECSIIYFFRCRSFAIMSSILLWGTSLLSSFWISMLVLFLLFSVIIIQIGQTILNYNNKTIKITPSYSTSYKNSIILHIHSLFWTYSIKSARKATFIAYVLVIFANMRLFSWFKNNNANIVSNKMLNWSIVRNFDLNILNVNFFIDA